MRIVVVSRLSCGVVVGCRRRGWLLGRRLCAVGWSRVGTIGLVGVLLLGRLLALEAIAIGIVRHVGALDALA